ncbi:MAG: DciA family protein [Rickettsiales bacterium]
MSTPAKKPFRKRHLFARSVSDVVKEATKPLMTKQGKIYGALLRDWSQIVGNERAAVTRPQRLQFPTTDASGAILHLDAKPSAAPELAYIQEQMLEQCARHLGYRAIQRIVIHATHEGFHSEEMALPIHTPQTEAPQALPGNIPNEMRGVLERLSQHVASPSDKKS